MPSSYSIAPEKTKRSARPAADSADCPADCPAACPGCAHRYLSPEESLKKKAQWLSQKLSDWQNAITPIKAADPGDWTGYRDMVCLSAQWRENRWAVGLLSGDTVIPIPCCPVHSPRVKAAIACLQAVLPSPPDFPMRYYLQSGAQVTLVVKSSQMPRMDWLDPELDNELKTIGIEGLWLHRHPCAGRKVFAKNRWDLVWGKARSSDRRGICRTEEKALVYGPTSFQQLIPALYQQALDAAEAFLKPGRMDLFFDLYCGIGSGLARWCRSSEHVTGVELSGESVSCAKKNAPAAVVYRGACRHRLPQLTAELARAHRKRLLLANPPRTGLETEVRRWITETCRPEKLAYLSCSAGTLRRDLLNLESQGYTAKKIIPYDFFPRTHHVETLAFIEQTRPAWG